MSKSFRKNVTGEIAKLSPAIVIVSSGKTGNMQVTYKENAGTREWDRINIYTEQRAKNRIV